jgi:hypothetical protein
VARVAGVAAELAERFGAQLIDFQSLRRSA